MLCRATPSAAIANLLLVAGPSGAGKSTFLEHLVSGTLEPSLRLELPAGCEQWEQVYASNFLKHLEDRSQDDASSLVVHYDLNKMHRAGASSFATEPAAQRIAAAIRVVVINILVSPQRLSAQLARKIFGGSNPDETNAAMRSEISPTRRTRQARTYLDLYAKPGWLESQSEQWNAFLSGLDACGRLDKRLAVTPEGSAYEDHDHQWRIVESGLAGNLLSDATESRHSLKI